MDGVVLFGLGVLGWQFLRVFRVPFPSLLGTVLVLGLLRLTGMTIPSLSGEWEFLIQVAFGFYVGSILTKDTMLKVQALLIPSLVSMIWVLALAFGGGWVLSALTKLDTLTAVLASSTGGLPEMTVIALDTHADVSVIVLLQILRISLVALLFPVLLRFWEPDHLSIKETISLVRDKMINREEHQEEAGTLHWIAPVGALLGGVLLAWVGVPAGGMVGAILAVSIMTWFGWRMHFRGHLFLDVLLIGIGVLAVSSLNGQVPMPGLRWSLAFPFVLSLVITMCSSLGLATVLWKTTEWDFVTCFLASAPAGLSITAALAIRHNKDPMPIFALHMARLFGLKVGIPILLTFLL